MPRPSQCGPCGLYEGCLYPQEPRCAEKLERGYFANFKPAVIKPDPAAAAQRAMDLVNQLTPEEAQAAYDATETAKTVRSRPKLDPMGRMRDLLEDVLPAINVLTLMGICTSKVTIVGEDGSRIWIGCREPEGHYDAAVSTRHRNYFGGKRDVEITWGDE